MWLQRVMDSDGNPAFNIKTGRLAVTCIAENSDNGARTWLQRVTDSDGNPAFNIKTGTLAVNFWYSNYVSRLVMNSYYVIICAFLSRLIWPRVETTCFNVGILGRA